ncbi:thioesterase II family protein [Micromonospora wenchangensis]|uniref:thioesterase II family protein n=1 Tax=Micromonospora wenchangensis TaxID=1185415 RepID=UPI003D728CDB
MHPTQELSATAERWITYPSPAPAARTKLLCLPYAGGGASLYRSWPALLPGVEVAAVQMPGHESRLGEPSHDRIEPLVHALATAAAPHLDKPYAIFGHSLGARVGFELARELRRRCLPGPVMLFASACRAPHVPRVPHPPVHAMSDPALLRMLRQMQTVPPEVLDDPDLASVLLPVMRADLNIVNSYEYTDEPALPCPIRVFGGTGDPEVREDDLYGWQAHTTSSFAVRMLPGGHLMIRQRAREITQTVGQAIAGIGC